MNLLITPWLPAIDLHGGARFFTLREAFGKAEEIRELRCGPAERISILRLLIAITQASQETPQDDSSAAWKAFAERMPAAVSNYLSREDIIPNFELFGEGPRFLQIRPAKAETMQTSKLFFHLASGGNPTHLDHAGGEDRAMSPESLALALLTFQNFSPLLGRGYTGRGPCVEMNAAHAFQLGKTLAETIVLNCLSRDAIAALSPDEGMGRPVWECPPQPPFHPKDPTTRNATRSYLGRLVPVARSVWLADTTQVVIANGPEFPDTPAGREPSTTMIETKKGDYQLLPLRLGRAIWRELPAFTATRSNVSCLTLRRGGNEDREIFVGGLVTDFKARIDDEVASLFTGRLAVPAALFADEDAAGDARGDYASAMTAADAWGTGVWLAIGGYLADLKVEAKQAAPLREAAQKDYWRQVERALPLLFNLLRGDEKYPQEPLAHPYAASSWHRALQAAAREVYRSHAPRGNARQFQAFGTGLRFLWPKNPDKKAKVP